MGNQLILNRIIIYLFVICLFSSNIVWAGADLSDSKPDNRAHVEHAVDLPDYGDNNTMHHLVDEHHDGHDCHMAAHLIGLNSTTISFEDFSGIQAYSTQDVPFFTRHISPPNKPPLA